MTRILSLVLLLPWALLSAQEEWVELFDGNSLEGWMAANEGDPGEGWEVVDGAIHRSGEAGPLVSRKEFGDFELEFEWRISEGGNSGVKYRVRKSPWGWMGPEFQILDAPADAAAPESRSGALYDVVAPTGEAPMQPAGEWNRARIVAVGARIEHWINGEQVVDVDLAAGAWEEQRTASKFARVDGFAGPGPGRILLQDHGGEVWFRGLRLRVLGEGEKSR